MASTQLARAVRSTGLRTANPRLHPSLARSFTLSTRSSTQSTSTFAPPICPPRAGRARFLSTTASRRLIVPDGQPKESVESPEVALSPAELTDGEYHKLADAVLETLVGHLEKLQDSREDVDVEYADNVLTASLGLDGNTYVLNKQPPNKQIWLSSPKTGPKRFDYVVIGDGQGDKQDTARGDWMYLRDQTTLHELILDEMGIDLNTPPGQ